MRNPVRLSAWPMNRYPPGSRAAARRFTTLLLRGLVEVDHDVAAEDHREQLRWENGSTRFRRAKLDLAADLRLDPVPALPAALAPQKKLPQPAVRNGLEALGRIDAAFWPPPEPCVEMSVARMRTFRNASAPHCSSSVKAIV